MLVQNAKNSKRSKVLSVVAIVLMVITAGVVYWTFFNDPVVDLVNADQVLRTSSIDTSFPTEVLEDQKIQELRLYGPSEVKVQLRGRKADPFLAF